MPTSMSEVIILAVGMLTRTRAYFVQCTLCCIYMVIIFVANKTKNFILG